MKTVIKLSDFDFKFSGYGHYDVTYTSPVTGKKWTTRTDKMPLIDSTKNADSPKIKDLNTLKNLCKGGALKNGKNIPGNMDKLCQTLTLYPIRLPRQEPYLDCRRQDLRFIFY
jgi:hypothetical protein